MLISDLSVRRPVFATVLSLLLIILGLMSANRLAVREYPDVNPPVVTVDTHYRGASAAVVESRITQVLEDQLAGIEGIEKLTSSSRDESSRVSIEFSLARDLDAAANDVRERIARIVDNLPLEADPPEISKVADNTSPVMWLNIASRVRSPLELTDYAQRYLADRFSTVPGVALVRVGGGRRYAMRVWLDRTALAARGLTVTDVEAALRRENVELPAGRLESNEREFTLRTETGLKSVADFRNLVIARAEQGRADAGAGASYLVRLGEVAEVALAPEDERSLSRSDGIAGISLGIVPNSKANLLDVARGVRAMMARVRPELPADMTFDVNMDLSIFVIASMKKVLEVLGETLFLVLVVIFLFLGTWRATLIPAVTIPVSIVAAATVMALAGFSINVLTLLGLVLAIGLVVDDAIVVLENIVRRIEAGEPPLLAALNGSREIAFAVIATTLVLIAVFLPLSYLQGNIGRLFGEFGVTLAAAVGFSALVALTLTPMMCSKLFAPARGPGAAAGIERGRLAAAVHRFFLRITARYERLLRRALRAPGWVVAGAAVVAGGAVALYLHLPEEYAPLEDRAMVFVALTAPEGASVAYRDRYVEQVETVLLREVERGNARRVLTRSGSFGRGSGDVNTAMLIAPLTLWHEREESAAQIAHRLRAQIGALPGVRTAVVLPGSLGVRGRGDPVQIVLGGGDYATLAQWRDRVFARVRADPGLAEQVTGLESDYYERKPQMEVTVDRNRAADLGVSLATVGRTLETMLGSRVVTTYLDRGEEYDVILQARPEARASPADLTHLYVRSETTGELVPLANLVQLTERAGPIDLKRFDRLRSITLSAGLAPGVALGEALSTVTAIVREEMPPGGQIGYDGESREFLQAGGALYFTFLLALAIVFLVLAAQFESFVHPLVIMSTVPLAVTGALVGLWLFGQSINVFSQIGIIMLVGIAAKNGILIVEFANQLRDRGRPFAESIVEAAVIRLRPVLMTSLCTAFGAVPLLIAWGAGAESRRPIGAAVFCGVICAVFLTLFVVPAAYTLLARRTLSPGHVARTIERLQNRPSGGP